VQLSFAEIDGDVRRLNLAGNLDIAGTLAVETKVLAHCGGEQPLVLIDLAETLFVSSLGIRLLMQAIKTVAARGGRLFLLNPSAPVASVLDIAGLDSHIFRGGEAGAAAALRQKQSTNPSMPEKSP